MSVALDLRKAPSPLMLASKVQLGAPPPGLSLSWPELAAVLPDHGLPRGVVELACAKGLGGGTRVALAAVKGGQERGARTWCAWLDPEGSLYAPGVARADVDLQRLLVVRPPRRGLAQVAVKLVQSQAFEVVVIDYAPPTFVKLPPARAASSPGQRRSPRAPRPEVLVRKLALLAEEGGSTIILLTDASEPRPVPWPVALRLELSRSPGVLTVKVAKDRFCRLATGRVAWPLAVPLAG
jgi:recombination protein RecA